MTLIKQVENKIYKRFFGETTGHDWHHINRVWSMANYIQKREVGNLDKGGKIAYSLLMELGAEELVTNEVRFIVNNVSYKDANNQPIHEPPLNVTMHDSFEEYAASKTSTINHFYEKSLLLKKLPKYSYSKRDR